MRRSTAADADAGGRTGFRQCRACHVMERGVHGVGPTLHAILGREIDGHRRLQLFRRAARNSARSGRSRRSTPSSRTRAAAAPGTSMGYAGMRGIRDRMNLIAWMERESQ
jgi:cytochrome c